MNRLNKLAFALSALISFGASAGPNIVQDPGFEAATLGPSWVSSGFYIDSSVSHSGAQSTRNVGCLFGCSDTITQDLVTTAGTTYDLSFWASTADQNSARPTVKVMWNGTAVFDSIINVTNTVQWVKYSVTGLVASGASTSLQFGITPAAVLFLDDVAVATPAVPEPTTVSLMLAGVASVGLSVLRRRRDLR